jgi:hypothetical protein
MLIETFILENNKAGLDKVKKRFLVKNQNQNSVTFSMKI